MLGIPQLMRWSSMCRNLPNLRTLAMPLCNLASLPDTIGNLSKLSTLEVRNNQLTGLPRSIRHLSTLHTIDISENDFPEFPSDIFYLDSLMVVCLSHAWLHTIPDAAIAFGAGFDCAGEEQAQRVVANLMREDYLHHWRICDRPLSDFHRIDLAGMTTSLHHQAACIRDAYIRQPS